MPGITPHLWFDKEAVEAAEFYAATFPDSKVTNVYVIKDTPSGDCDVVSFEVCRQPFQAISAGPVFKFNPSVSFLVRCSTSDQVDELWSKLSDGGEERMPLGSYPFSDRYGWTDDRFGVSWQVMHDATGEIDQAIVPTLLFVRDVCGKAEEAANHYTSVFPNSKVDHVMRYGEGEEPDKPGTVRHLYCSLGGYKLAAMDSAHPGHDFGFNEAISFIVPCEDQDEIDYYWDKLSAVPESEQCGWLKDRFGVSWQVVPTVLDEMMSGTEEQAARVVQAFLQMKKFDIAELQRAYEGVETRVGGQES